jgi:hypothetical protein
MVSARIGRQGINLVDPTLIPLVQYEIAYRELGAVIYVDRLWNNLLTSQALTFNLFSPFKRNLALATAVMRRLVPDLVGEVTGVRFEHSPGRGQPRFTADHTAFDVLLHCTTPQGRSAFVAIEVKYSEAPAGVASPARPRYDALSREAGVFRDPDAPALRYAPIEQFWREQLLVAALLGGTGTIADTIRSAGDIARSASTLSGLREGQEAMSDDPILAALARLEAVKKSDVRSWNSVKCLRRCLN